MSGRSWWGDELLNRGADDDVWAVSRTAVTLGELRRAVTELTRTLSGNGIERHSTVALRMTPSYTLIQTLLALWTLGAQVTLLDARMKRPEYERLLDLREPQYHVHSGTQDDLAAGFQEDAELVVRRRPTGRPDDTDVCLVQFSSGSTGTPKVIGRSAESVLAEQDRYAGLAGMPARGERLVLLNSVIHTMGLFGGVLHALNVGTTLVFPPGPQPADVLRAAASTNASAVFGVPVHFDLLSRVRDVPALPALRLAVSAGELLPVEVHERFGDTYGLAISPVYGMTEVGVITADLSGGAPPPAVGRLVAGIDVKVSDDELYVRLDRSPYLSQEPTDRFANGWLRTYDRFSQDPHTGMLSMLGRADSVVTIGGLKVDLTEVEIVLRQHPKVDVAVVTFGAAIEAFIGTGQSLSAGELVNWCRERLSDVKIPKRFFIGSNVPRNANGKLLRSRELLHAARHGNKER